MLTLTDEQLDWLTERIPDAPKSPLGGRPPADKRKVIRGIFWILDNGAKRKDRPRRFGSKSTVHRWFQTWVRDGLFEQIMPDAGRCVARQGGYRLYECFIGDVRQGPRRWRRYRLYEGRKRREHHGFGGRTRVAGGH